jgi:hypothetical protein
MEQEGSSVGLKPGQIFQNAIGCAGGLGGTLADQNYAVNSLFWFLFEMV